MKRHAPLPRLLVAVVIASTRSPRRSSSARWASTSTVPLVDGLLSLSHVRNRGAAFGLLSDADLPYQSVLLATLSLAALGAIGFYFLRLPPSARLPRLALALVLGGALGNLVDRVRLGYVVDFIHVYWRQHQWPDFNVGRLRDHVGVALLVLDILRSPGSATPGDKTEIDAAASPAGRID